MRSCTRPILPTPVTSLAPSTGSPGAVSWHHAQDPHPASRAAAATTSACQRETRRFTPIPPRCPWRREAVVLPLPHSWLPHGRPADRPHCVIARIQRPQAALCSVLQVAYLSPLYAPNDR